MDLITGSGLDGFTFVPTGNLDRPIPTGHCICKHCGERVENGIMNLAEHWRNCWGKDEFDEMIADPQAYRQKKVLELMDLL
jgi:hypothetical protein